VRPEARRDLLTGSPEPGSSADAMTRTAAKKERSAYPASSFPDFEPGGEGSERPVCSSDYNDGHEDEPEGARHRGRGAAHPANRGRGEGIGDSADDESKEKRDDVAGGADDAPARTGKRAAREDDEYEEIDLVHVTWLTEGGGTDGVRMSGYGARSRCVLSGRRRQGRLAVRLKHAIRATEICRPWGPGGRA